MTALSALSRRPSRVGAPRRLSALIAMFAVVGMLVLATWHDALPHVHEAGHIVSVALDDHEHDHAPSQQPDTADLMHLAAHAVLQTIDLPSPPVLAALMAPMAAAWARAPASGGHSLPPPSILRPPRG
ncbi:MULTISPECIES: hypothetical protein [Sphingomonas]|uniref:hypothetical protein n=1 Tax=Sphingomonas TaxID=13687 RepID=UPI00254D1C40|nr:MULTISPECIES: hypothetical protein [Sphingomonas]MDK8187391.1 hypothetical protein [Sphingomonas zeae]MDK8217164.1 hypothetical protein [Sphingomonas sp. UMB7805-LC452B]